MRIGIVLASGIVLFVCGLAMASSGPEMFPIGIGFAMIGAFGIGSAGCALAPPPRWDEEDADAWTGPGRWAPECPAHGEQMCYLETERCPGVRHRIE